MNVVLKFAKAVLPDRVGRSLRREHRTLVLRRAMRVFLADPIISWQRNPRLLSDLIYGWGNETFSAREEYLSACLEHALVRRGSILECGSGLTTILVGALLERCGGSLCALEHDAAWYEKIGACLEHYGIHCAHVVHAPLINYGTFSWYDVPLEALPQRISLIICDGPPAGTPGGRYGVVPLMRERLAPGSVVLLDDAGREQEHAIADRWSAELGRRYEMFGEEKPYARIAI